MSELGGHGILQGVLRAGAREHNATLYDAEEVWYEMLMEATCEATE